MKYSKIAITAATIIALWGCSSGTSSKYKGQTTMGEYQVTWIKMTTKNDPKSQTPIFFSFSPTSIPSSLVTEANWQTEAQNLNSTVEKTKNMLGSDVYPSKDGGVATCTQDAIRKGFCGERSYPSMAKKILMAEQALSLFPSCRWTGFDPSFDATMVFKGGAREATLWVKADCS